MISFETKDILQKVDLNFEKPFWLGQMGHPAHHRIGLQSDSHGHVWSVPVLPTTTLSISSAGSQYTTCNNQAHIILQLRKHLS